MTDAPTTRRELPASVDVLIVGGGVAGCSIAYHLAERGAGDVLLLERHQLTSGTTWHAAGLVGQLRATENLTRLARYTTDLYERIEAETGQATGFRQNGSLGLATCSARMEELARGAAMARRFGLECQMLSPGEIRERWPMVETGDLEGGVFLPRDGQINPVDVTRALAIGARAKGVTIREGVSVSKIQAENGRAVGVVLSDGQEIAAGTVVLAAGLWSRDLAGKAGVDLPLYPAEHFYVVTEAVANLPRDLPVLRDPDNCIYLKEDAGKLLVGAFEPESKPIDPDTLGRDFAFGELPFDLDHFQPWLEAAMRRVPVLEQTGIKTFFCGPESFTPDDRYLLGPAPGLEGLFVATGFNSIGIQVGWRRGQGSR